MNLKSKNPNSANFGSRLREALARFVRGKNHPGHLPHIPSPGQALPDPLDGISDDFSETTINVKQVGNTGIAFGKVEGVKLDADGNGQEIIKEPSYRIGSGSIVSSIEQIAGICGVCEVAATEAYLAGRISLQEAHLRTMYDHPSAAQCDICGQRFCTMHCRPVKINEDVVSTCAICLKVIQKKELRRKILAWLLAPLSESTLPNNEDNQR